MNHLFFKTIILYATVVTEIINVNSVWIENKVIKPIIVGQNLTLYCYQYVYERHSKPILYWETPNLQNQKTQTIIGPKNNNEILYTSQLSIQNVSDKDIGNYTCKYKHKKMNEISKSNIYFLNIKHPLKPLIYNLNIQIVIDQNQSSIKMSCFAKGKPSPSITWFKNNKRLSLNGKIDKFSLQNKSQILTINVPTLAYIGTYVCNASNRHGNDIKIFNIFPQTDNIIFQHERTNNVLVIVLYSVLITVLGIFVIFIIVYSKIGKTMKRKFSMILGGMFSFRNGVIINFISCLGIEKPTNLLFRDKLWEFPVEKLNIGKPLDAGYFSVVFKATAVGIINANDTTTVAVKTLKPTTDPSFTKTLVSESEIMVNLGHHLNILNILGMCIGTNKQLMIIFEYCRFGNVHQYLLKNIDCFINQIRPNGSINYDITTTTANSNSENVINMNYASNAYDSNNGSQIGSDGCKDDREKHKDRLYRKTICTRDLIYWSFQISKGMEYISNRKIIHRDLAARNILLTNDNIVKICDFERSINTNNNDTYKNKSKKIIMPLKWMAVESIRDLSFSTKSDVWSFGIVLWEMFSLAETLYPNIHLSNLFNKLDNGYRMSQPKYANLEIYHIMIDCWDAEPSKRPSFTELAKFFGDLLKEGTRANYVESTDSYVKINEEKLPKAYVVSSLIEMKYSNLLVTSENYP